MPDNIPDWVLPAAGVGLAALIAAGLVTWLSQVPNGSSSSSSSPSGSSSSSSPSSSPGPLTLVQSVGDVIGPQPDGSYQVLIDMTATGGTIPYAFALTWDDATEQTSSGGSFVRTFPGYPTSEQGRCRVTSADGQTLDIAFQAPLA